MSNSDKKQFFNRILSAGQTRKLDRRQFMSHAMAVGMTMSGAAALWTEQVSAQTPKKVEN